MQISKREDFNPSIETKTTDNPDWAPEPDEWSNYSAGGDFWWRVAAIDGDGNVGAFATNPAHFTLPRLSGGGSRAEGVQGHVHRPARQEPRRETSRSRSATATTLNALQGALVRAYGAGVSLTQKTTNSSGVAKFRLKPTQLKKVTFRVSKLTATRRSTSTAACIARRL